ncbi:MCE family protein [Pseudonocardia acaciae]|uniref:MCE family protein n=1 Tax=Pseudonocardia acaciae TaxID=551276 RepID=UPI000491DE8E|nr:MCE family protein [Pseudonocardia acaciae]
MRNVLAPSVKLAVFTVVTVLLTGVLAATIANANLGSTTGYTAIFTDGSGLQPGDDVRMRGVKIGQVDELRVRDDRYAAVSFDVDKTRTLPAGVTATIKYRNLIGQRYLSLDAPPGGPPGTLRPDGVIPVERTHPALNLTELFNGFQPLFQALSPADVNKLSYEIIQVFQGEGTTIEELLGSTASLTNTLADRDQVVGQVIDNLNTVIGTVADRSPQLSELIDTLQRLVSGLSEQREPIGRAIKSIGTLTQTTGSLLDSARPPLKSDIAELGRLSGNLNHNSPEIERVIQGLAPKLDALTRTVSYGSWFNFYLCQVNGTVSVDSLGVKLPVLPPPGTTMPPRCGP